MQNVGLVLLAFAFVTACIATRYATIGGYNMLAVAVAFWIAAELLGGMGRVFR